MTNKEAIKHLQTYSTTNGSGQTTQTEHEEAKRAAISALSQPQPDIEAIRQDIVSSMEDIKGHYSNTPFRDMPSSKIYRNEGRQECLDIIDKYIQKSQDRCDKCEVGNPCLYCKHEFEPQERSRKK